ncbi:MAG TPA: acyltransferase [Candidatus Hydrogenedentes bacterium]|nr:acyltransferase [Candidatus Hydrogenedentota bacterium]HOT50972.1 acyltransferase [Candidatus Hydrogenedentota bacterium]HOV72891.1 acyltransferase [Candidatus Hydrogenedentota bacterium]HPC16428.1 acyltransferase [Candidatus Hydrogenedentota bacterium]HRT20361.1 acyltransferase [Candidatus Hydrogenedentota bacterium]
MNIGRLLQKLKLRYGSQETVIRTLRDMGVQIGERCRIYTAHFGTEPWLIRIGNHVCISNDVTFVNHDLNWPFQDKYESLTGFGTIEIRDNCQIGVRATILPRVVIGPNAIVGACSVVTKDVPPNTVVAGNPAVVICTLDEYEAKCRERHLDIPKDREAARAFLVRHFWGGGR